MSGRDLNQAINYHGAMIVRGVTIALLIWIGATLTDMQTRQGILTEQIRQLKKSSAGATEWRNRWQGRFIELNQRQSDRIESNEHAVAQLQLDLRSLILELRRGIIDPEHAR